LAKRTRISNHCKTLIVSFPITGKSKIPKYVHLHQASPNILSFSFSPATRNHRIDTVRKENRLKYKLSKKFIPVKLAAAGMLLCSTLPSSAQDLDPRRWSHLPSDMNYAGLGYAYTSADVFFDPVLELKDVSLDLHTYAAKYLRTFKLLDRSARVEFTAPYQNARWEGLLGDTPASTIRDGFADPLARFAINLIGAPPLKASEFATYRATHPVETIVGAGLTVQMPLGNYYSDKLLNLGENRYTIRPELGVEHRRGKWMTEITGSVAFFTENDDFFNGNEREQNPFYIVQGLLSYTFRPGLWTGAGLGYGFGGESQINGVDKYDRKGNIVTGWVLGVPINKALGVKFAYLHSVAQENTGADSDTVGVAMSALW